MKTKNSFKLHFISLVVFSGWVLSTAESSYAETKKPARKNPPVNTTKKDVTATPATSSVTTPVAKPIRKKELDFEERIIEGLTDRGLESFTQTGTIDPISKEKLYRKRDDFEDASKALLREMEYLK